MQTSKSIVRNVKPQTGKNIKDYSDLDNSEEKSSVNVLFWQNKLYKFYILNSQSFTYLKSKRQGILDSKISGMNRLVPYFQVLYASCTLYTIKVKRAVTNSLVSSAPVRNTPTHLDFLTTVSHQRPLRNWRAHFH